MKALRGFDFGEMLLYDLGGLLMHAVLGGRQ